MTPAFTVLIGSIGRATLMDTLKSVHRQKREVGDQCLVAIDTFEDDDHRRERSVSALVKTFGDGFIPVAYNSGYHFYGVEQINHAMRTVPITGSHIITLGDDDVFVDGAYRMLRPICAADPLRPVFYKFLTPPTDPQGRPWREILWDVPRLVRSRISGCCIAAPTPFVGPMPTKTTNDDGSPYVEHDFDWMMDIVEQSGRDPLWLDEVLVLARPDPHTKTDVKHRGLVRCWHCPHWRYLEDVSVLEPRCPKCHVVMQVSELVGRTA